MNEPICPHCSGGPADEQHQRECEEDTVLYQQQSRIADLERQLAESQRTQTSDGVLVEKLRTERDRYKALAERECLRRSWTNCEEIEETRNALVDYCGPCWMRAALAATPEGDIKTKTT